MTLKMAAAIHFILQYFLPVSHILANPAGLFYSVVVLNLNQHGWEVRVQDPVASNQMYSAVCIQYI